MLIYVPHITPRISYTMQTLLVEVIGLAEIRFTHNESDFEIYQDLKLNYSTKKLNAALHVCPKGLLAEKDISPQKIEISTHKNTPIFFQTEGASLPFDVFSASFYLISRYEEYLPYTPDVHGRYTAEQSLAYQNKFLQQPVVSIWCGWLKAEILKAYPNAFFSQKKYQYTATVDVDNVYAYRGKGIWRSAGALVKDVLALNTKQFIERLEVLLSVKTDPYDTFLNQIKWYEERQILSIYFMLFSEFGPNDRNISMHSCAMKEKVQQMAKHTAIAIHPSYQSHVNFSILKNEVEKLGALLGKKVTQSRQHYLKITLPETYRNLIALGVTDDYSMGYASHPGFRAGMALPFLFYDIKAEQTTALTVHPFMLMDVTFIDYQKCSTDEAWAQMQAVVEATRAVNGHLITVFHNRVCSGHAPEWQGWPELYQKLLTFARP